MPTIQGSEIIPIWLFWGPYDTNDDADDDDDDDYANLDEDECRTVGKWLSLGGKPRRRRRVISLLYIHSLPHYGSLKISISSTF